MQLTFFRLAPLLGLHAIVCLCHLYSRPTFAWWQNRQITAPPPIAQALNGPWASPPRAQPIQP